jgi:protein SCO1
MRRIAYALAAFAALSMGAMLTLILAPVLSRATLPADASELSFRPHPGAKLPLATKVQDENGRDVTLAEYFYRSPVILVFDYLRCTSLCGVTLRRLVESLDELPPTAASDSRLVAISIDPRDGPADAAAAKAKYVAPLQHGRNAAHIHFLTASPSAVEEITQTAGFPYRYEKSLDAYIHPAGFIVARPDGVISRYIEGAVSSPTQLIEALADAQQRKSQDLITRIVLLCHVQGAPLGRFTVPVLAAFMSANIAAGFMAVAIFVAVRRRAG